MSDTEGKLANIGSEQNDENIKLYNDEDDSFILTYYMKSIVNDKAIIRIIHAVERMFRTSAEYNHYLGNIRKSTGFNNCSIFGGVTDDNATIEFHHYPFTLYDIVQSVILKSLSNKQTFSTFTLARDVTILHFQNKVGIVPLSKTVHQMVHTGALFLPLDFVLGDYVSFVDDFQDVFTNKIREKYNAMVKKTKELKDTDFNPNILALEPQFLSTPALPSHDE